MDEKAGEFDYAPFGIIGLETALGLSLGLVQEGTLSLAALLRKLGSNPAAIMKLNKGTLAAGADADITLIDPDLAWTVAASEFKSKSRNTPFDGWKLKGKAVRTIVGGKL
jgi:dihydroorotase